jgi:hypothetical protein
MDATVAAAIVVDVTVAVVTVSVDSPRFSLFFN